MSLKKNVGFLYFEEIHHIAHFIGIAAELYKISQKCKVDIITYPGKHEYLYKLLELLEVDNINVVQLSTYRSRQIIDALSGRKKPSALYLYKKNSKTLMQYDALVFTEMNHKYVHKYRKNSKTPYLISVGHGPGGRGYAFQPSLKLLDLILLCGNFYMNRLKNDAYLINNYKIIGYSKFDVVLKENPSIQLFDNDRPIVLYNPHFNKINSSWYTYGTQILEYFYTNEKFNLVFAPHMYLFNRKGFENPAIIDKKYFNCDHIHMDLGSIKSSNMTYILNCDMYLGDVSSQIFEFSLKPRPAIFIDVEGVDWKDDINYRFWKTGDVVCSMEELKQALLDADKKKEQYLSIQKQFFKENFDQHPELSASERGAMAIEAFFD